MLEDYLRAPPEFQDVAITSSEHYGRTTDIVIRELALGYIAEYFKGRALMGHPERLGRRSAGAGAGGGVVNNSGNREPKDPSRRKFGLETWLNHLQNNDEPRITGDSRQQSIRTPARHSRTSSFTCNRRSAERTARREAQRSGGAIRGEDGATTSRHY